ncbi:response regulator transcription factor [Streptomyces sp. NPDC056527]|uniref:response regulator transcription factor n=1 Tax=Streptomyces sp. NPDC056527 TaxID=3345853 RepID=UPI0036CECBCC
MPTSGGHRGQARQTFPTTVDVTDLERLTAREREVLHALAHGETNRVLARRFGIAERTVKAHITSVVRKLELSSRIEATLVSLHHQDRLNSCDHPSLGAPESIAS